MIPLLVGKNSNGEDRFLDLSQTSLLMISYCEEKQVDKLFRDIQNLDYPYKALNYFMTNSRRLRERKIDLQKEFVYLIDEPEMGNIKTRLVLLNQIHKEMIRRQKLMSQNKIKDFSRYISLNTWNAEKLNYCFLLIDDVWDLVTAKPKSIALQLINILINGPAYGIHTVFASRISYRNLLEQLITVNPKIRFELQKKFGIPEPTRISLLGSELIFNPDELIFYKKGCTMDLERLFKK